MTNNEDDIRVFIAIPIEDQVKKLITSTTSSIVPDSEKGISKVRPDSIHLTVRFLGNIDSATAEKVKTVLSLVTKDLKAFRLKSTGFKYLPSKHKLRTLTIGIEDKIELTALFDSINKGLLESEIDSAVYRDYTPHLTLFRTKTKGASTTLIKNIDRFKENSKKEYNKLLDLEFTINEVVLYKSTITPEGAIHKPLGVFKFKN